ncbi:alkaline phosphatase-like protein [Saccharata proteae CBS 121410]|uniref:Alkaline phosphatase-like protein n=1 Tax=Saccharata proteae CBS 121410 TaxID=1314787 RepID=A0A9P4LUB0_9PEZI|nr:alkaline phosphatase-like protein [Saccharata proteae CBS 121410]
MSTTRPNFLLIVADDLGFSDTSCYGSEISTPHIDSLANDSNGTRFTNFHVASMCSPTRSMLMSGTDNHIAGLGNMAEFIKSSPAHQGKPGHEGYLNQRVAALPELLGDGGYHTIMSGKWHLGLKKEQSPQARGFQKSFALLPGCANHYGYEPQYEDIHEPGAFFENAVTALHVEGSEYVEKLPEGFYSSDFYASKLISFLDERTEDERETPFFAYLPFTAPHWPLQAPRESIDKYKGVYDDGPAALRLKRLESLKRLSLVDPNVRAHDVISSHGEPAEWDDMDTDTRAKSARAMETYAGMVDRMDWNIGRVLDYLKKTGQYDNTYIIFMSDNGAEGASIEARPILGTHVVKHLQKYYNNSLENIGRKDSFVWYGGRWAQAATAPSRLYKRFSTEGGCRVPLVLKPAAIEGDRAAGKGGKVSDAYCTVMDIVPTLLELAGLEHPGTEYRGRPIEPVRGTSWKRFLDALRDENGFIVKASVHPSDYVMGFEVAGSAALRRGKDKITFVPKPKGPQEWELFDMEKDPGETTDLRHQQPELFAEMMELWEKYKNEVGVVGVAGEYEHVKEADDEFEDNTRWIRWIGKKDIPPQFVGKVPS